MMTGLRERYRFFMAFARAALRHGTDASDLITSRWALMCPRAMAAGRLAIRALAAGSVRPGGWTAEEIGAEWDRMGLPPGRRRGCGCYSCAACNPPACPECGGSRSMPA